MKILNSVSNVVSSVAGIAIGTAVILMAACACKVYAKSLMSKKKEEVKESKPARAKTSKKKVEKTVEPEEIKA